MEELLNEIIELILASDYELGDNDEARRRSAINLVALEFEEANLYFDVVDEKPLPPQAPHGPSPHLEEDQWLAYQQRTEQVYENRLIALRDLLLAGEASNWIESDQSKAITGLPESLKSAVLGAIAGSRSEAYGKLKINPPTEQEIYKHLREQWGLGDNTDSYIEYALMDAVKKETDKLWPQQQSKKGVNPDTNAPYSQMKGTDLLDMFSNNEGFMAALAGVLDDEDPNVTPEETTAVKAALMKPFGGLPPPEDTTELEERKIRQDAPEEERIYRVVKDFLQFNPPTAYLFEGKTDKELRLWIDRNTDEIKRLFELKQDSEQARAIPEKDRTSLEEFVISLAKDGRLSPEIPKRISEQERKTQKDIDDAARILAALLDKSVWDEGEKYWATDLEKWWWVQDHVKQIMANVKALQEHEKASGIPEAKTTTLEEYVATELNLSVIKQIEQQAILAGKTEPVVVPDGAGGFKIVNMTPEQKLLHEAQVKAAQAEADAKAKEDLARKEAIATAPYRAQIEQALLQMPFFQNMDAFTRKTYLDRVTNNVTEAYEKLEAQESAQGMLGIEKTTMAQFVQAGGAGFITETMPPAITINSEGIAIDTTTGKRAPTLQFGQAVARDPYGGQFKRYDVQQLSDEQQENIRKISGDLAIGDDAFRKWLDTKIASPEFQAKHQKADREYRLAALGTAYEKAYTAERKGEVPMGDPITIDKGRADLSPPTFPALEGVAPFRKAGETRRALGEAITEPSHTMKTLDVYAGEQHQKLKQEFEATPEGAIFKERQHAKRLRPTGEAIQLGGRVSPLGRI